MTLNALNRPSPNLPIPLPPAVHIVEDDDDVRAATGRLLTAAGFAVRTYASAADFVAALPTANPGCVILDVRLPDSSGLDVQEMLAAAAERCP